MQLVDVIQEDLQSMGTPEHALNGFKMIREAAAACSPMWYNDVNNFKCAVETTLAEQRDLLAFLEVSPCHPRPPNPSPNPAPTQSKASPNPRASLHPPTPTNALVFGTPPTATPMHPSLQEPRAWVGVGTDLAELPNEGHIDIARHMRKMAYFAARSGQREASIHLLSSMQRQLDNLPDAATRFNARVQLGRRLDRASRVDDARTADDALRSITDSGQLGVCDEADRWRLRCAATLLGEGCTQPWPPIITALISHGGRRVVRAFVSMVAYLYAEANEARSEARLRGSHGVDVIVLRRKGSHLWQHATTDGASLQLKTEATDVNVSTETMRYDEAAVVLPCDAGGCGALLRSAAEIGHLEMVKGLVEVGGVSPCEADPQGNTAFHCATNGGHASTVKFF